MNAEFLAILEYWEREKGINKDVLVKAVEDALLSAAKKAVGPARELRCAIDPKTGDIRAFAKLVVSERVISKHDQISLFDARRIKPDAQFGEEVDVKAVEQTPHGPEIILSRADPQFVVKLFQLEVSEISDGTIEIKSIAREPGLRTKLAVSSRDEKVDPVGACVGLRGQRVKNIVRE